MSLDCVLLPCGLYRLFMLFIGSFIHIHTVLGVAAARCCCPAVMRIICLINHATIAKILAKDTKVSCALSAV